MLSLSEKGEARMRSGLALAAALVLLLTMINYRAKYLAAPAYQ